MVSRDPCVPLAVRLLNLTAAACRLPTNPNASGAATVRVESDPSPALNTVPSPNLSPFAVLTWNAAGTSTCAPAPKVTPAGLMKKKLGAPPCSGRSASRPLIWVGDEPLTRLMTFCSEAVLVVNTAASPAPTLKLWKL